MTLKEVKAMSNEDMICTLCMYMDSIKIRAYHVSDAEKMIKELHRRKVVDNPEDFLKRWVEIYSFYK